MQHLLFVYLKNETIFKTVIPLSVPLLGLIFSDPIFSSSKILFTHAPIFSSVPPPPPPPSLKNKILVDVEIPFYCSVDEDDCAEVKKGVETTDESKVKEEAIESR